MSFLEIIDEIPEVSRLIALELKKNLEPQKDSITQNKAHQEYGRKWVEKYVRLGQLHPQFHGSRKMYSISELERVRTKENLSAKLMIKQS